MIKEAVKARKSQFRPIIKQEIEDFAQQVDSIVDQMNNRRKQLRQKDHSPLNISKSIYYQKIEEYEREK